LGTLEAFLSALIWGDDIGQSNLSCYTHGLMGYRTRNIDRLAEEGMIFTDWLRAGSRSSVHRDVQGFPPAQKAATFTLGDALEKMSTLATLTGAKFPLRKTEAVLL